MRAAASAAATTATAAAPAAPTATTASTVAAAAAAAAASASGVMRSAARPIRGTAAIGACVRKAAEAELRSLLARATEQPPEAVHKLFEG